MKILVVSNYYPESLGGIEIVAHNLVTHYRRTGHEVRWIANDIADRKHACQVDDFPLRSVDFESTLGFPSMIPHPVDLWSTVQHANWCDIVHANDCLYVSNQFIFRAARRQGKPVVTTQQVGLIPYRESYKLWLQKVAWRSLGKSMLQHSDQVVFVNAIVQKWFDQFVQYRRPPLIIPNGADSEIFHPAPQSEISDLRKSLHLPSDRPILLFVGRFTQKKGLGIIRTVARETPQWSWILIGRQAEENPSAWGLPNLLVFPAQSQQMLRNYYCAADLLVLPSVGEGLPLVVAESMACGTTAVVCPETADAIPNLRELVTVTEPEPAALTRSIAQALSMQLSRPELRPKAAQFARDVFDWHSIAGKYCQIFETVIAK